MAITAISHSVCLDCSENSFTITGTKTGSPDGTPGSTLYVTDPSGNLTQYDADDLYNNGTQTITAGTTNITGSNSISSVTLDWGTAVAGTEYSFIFRTLINGYIQDYVISATPQAGNPLNAQVGFDLAAALNAISGIVNIATTTYSGAGSTLTINANAGVYFGVANLNNLTSTSSTPNTTTTTATFADGVWIVKWVVTDDGAANPSPSITNSIFLCNVEKCVREKASKVDVGCGCCGTRESEEAMDVILYLEGIKSAAACGKLEKAKTILSGLEDICNNDCKHC